MQTIQYSKLILAIVVVICFSAIGVGIALRNLPFIFFATALGFGFMAYGIVQKKKNSKS